MKQKTPLNKRTIAVLSLFLINGLFLSVLIFPLSEAIKLGVSLVMGVLLILWVSYALGNLPSLARSGSVLVYFLLLGLLYTGLLMLPFLSSLTSSSLFQSVFTMIATIILVWTHFPNRIKQAVELWQLNKSLSNQDPSSTHLEDHVLDDAKEMPISYAQYRQRRSLEILRSKPTSLMNATKTMAIVRLGVFMVLYVGGMALILIGLNALPLNTLLNSLTVWLMVLGLGLTLISLFVILEGLWSALINGAMILPVLVLLTFVLDRVVSLYNESLSIFVIALGLFIMTIGILLYQWIKALLLHYTIALLMFKRGEVWLGLEQLLNESLPIEHYDHLSVVEIQVDEQFDLAELMFLGPKLERYAQSKKIIFAGLCFDPSIQKVALYFCVKNQLVSERHLARFFKRHFHYSFTLTHDQDPKIVLAQLTPTQDELIEANNRTTVFHYEDEGIDLAELHHIILILTFTQEVSMNQAKLDLSQEGFGETLITDTRIQPEFPGSKDNGWLVISVQHQTRLGLDRVNLLTHQINQIIQPTQGKVSYWVLGKFQEVEQETQTAQE